jgi:hypothetical protein
LKFPPEKIARNYIDVDKNNFLLKFLKVYYIFLLKTLLLRNIQTFDDNGLIAVWKENL